MRLWFGVGGLVAALAAMSLLTAPGSRAAGACSMTEAETLANQYDMGDAHYGRVAQVLCGPFTGAQSNAMAFSFHWYGCIPFQGWAVFRFTGSDWRLVLRRDREVAVLAAQGSDIRATVDVFRSGDPHCVNSGGRRSRVWHWNGKQLVGASWIQVTPAERSTKTSASFYSPSGNLVCEMDDGRAGVPNLVHCQSWKKPQVVTMNVHGRLKICLGERCLGNPGENTPHLGYGRQITVGRFRCSSLQAGVKCIVISSGKGFLIDKVRVRRIV